MLSLHRFRVAIYRSRFFAPFFDPTSRERAGVALTLGVTLPSAHSERLKVVAVVSDGEGREQVAQAEATVEIGLREGESREYDINSNLSLRPGRYNIRVGAQRGSDSRSGSVFASVIVPNFEKERLSLSGLILSRAGVPPAAVASTLKGVFPLAPTVFREFDASDQVVAFVRVHQATHGSVVPATVTTQIVNSSGQLATSDTRTLASTAFAGGGGVDYRFPLPLVALPSGEYLLRVVVSTPPAAEARRDIRFIRR